MGMQNNSVSNEAHEALKRNLKTKTFKLFLKLGHSKLRFLVKLFAKSGVKILFTFIQKTINQVKAFALCPPVLQKRFFVKTHNSTSELLKGMAPIHIKRLVVHMQVNNPCP